MLVVGVVVGLLVGGRTGGGGTEPAGTAPEPTAPLEPAPPEPEPAEVGPLSAEELGRRFGDAVWRVDVEGCGTYATGTAFAIAPDLFVTNAHVVLVDPTPVLTARDGQELAGEVIGYRDWPDVAVIRVDRPLETFLAWAPADELSEGQPLTALGYPTPLLAFTVSPGYLLSFQVEDGERVALVSDEITDYGSSGGPLLDDRGRVAGVVTEFAAHDGRQLVGLSYTYDFLRAHLDEIVASPTTVEPDCSAADLAPLPDGWEGTTNPDADDYGSDAGLDLLWDACAEGDFHACDDLYRYSPLDSQYEAFGDTCGGRNEPGDWCAVINDTDGPPALDREGHRYGDDPELDALWDGCAEGYLEACDDLYRYSPIGSEYEAFGDTCGERNEPSTWCVDLYP